MPQRSVIIADNNTFYHRVIGDLYREMGFDVRLAHDGLEVLGHLRERAADLLVLDLIMPRIDGARLCRLVKNSKVYRHIPVIILSGILTDEIEDLESIPADAYIAKMRFEQTGEALRSATRQLMCGEMVSRPLLCGFEGMYRREVVRELLEEARRKRTIFESLSEGTAELSGDRRILATNKAFSDILGRGESELLSLPLEDSFGRSHPVLAALFEEVDKEGRWAWATLSHAGRELNVKLHPCAVNAGSGEAESSGYTLLIEDISDRVKAQQQREQLRARLQQSERLAAVGMFISGTAHELNNPLTSVLGYAQLLQERHRGTELARKLEKIAAGASRCRSIVEKLMAFTRCLKPEQVETDLNALLAEVSQECLGSLQEIGADLSLELSPDVPAATADAAQLRQAFELILDNAVQALRSSSATRRLTVASRAAGERVRIEFADTGPGIPSEHLGKVFDPFFTTRAVGDGQGLGLSVAYGITMAHGGRITAGNSPAGGAVITMELPVGKGHDSVGQPLSRESSRKRILIVDDESVVVELLADILEGAEHQIDAAADGREGILKVSESDYDLVILDLRMPDMTGQEMYEALARQRPEMLDKLIFITADTMTPEVQEFLGRVGNPCLYKPFSVSSVVEAVREVLGGGSAA